jgi:hypothetical protein
MSPVPNTMFGEIIVYVTEINNDLIVLNVFCVCFCRSSTMITDHMPEHYEYRLRNVLLTSAHRYVVVVVVIGLTLCIG